MRAVMLEIPEALFEERRRLGHDRRDEVWDGVVHMVPQPSYVHQSRSADLIVTLRPVAAALGLDIVAEVSIFADPGERNYRVPDLVIVDPTTQVSRRGVEGRAEIVIELLSPDDESRDKLPFYAEKGVREVWLIDPDTRAFELYTLRGGTYFAVAPDARGAARSTVLGVELATVEGPKLQITWTTGAAAI